MDVFEAMGTARAMRFFQTDPVPDELVEKVLWAATRASSGNNTQGWDFVVVRDAEQRARLGEALVRLRRSGSRRCPTPGTRPTVARWSAPRTWPRTFAQVPVIIVVCGANIYPPDQPRETFMYSAVYAAAQNLVVAARALGLGAAFTTLHRRGRAAVPRDPRHPRRPLPSASRSRSAGPPAPSARSAASPSTRSSTTTAGSRAGPPLRRFGRRSAAPGERPAYCVP